MIANFAGDVQRKDSTMSFRLAHLALVGFLPWLFTCPVYGQANAPGPEASYEDNWSRLVEVAEALLGDEGVLSAKDPEQRINAIVDLHAKYCALVGEKPPSSQRILIVKQGLRMFLRTASARYSGDKRQAALRFIKDLATNRAVFAELLTSDTPAEVIEAQLMAYLERNQNLSYKQPVPIKDQFSAVAVQALGKQVTPLVIEAEQVRLISDQGASGHFNCAIDAGETITLNIPLKNASDRPFRSTSAFILTDDEYVKSDSSEAVYTQKEVVSGDTVTFGPGLTVAPKQHFTFTVLPTCPDGHMVKFKLLVWDTDQGKFYVPFEIKVYHVGPLDFGQAFVDDDVPGPSNGNSNGILEPGETIEYTLPVKNVGKVAVQNVTATLFSSETAIQFKSGEDVLKYKEVLAERERPIAASFVFGVDKDPVNVPSSVALMMLVQGEARGFKYSWLQARTYQSGAMSVVSHCPAKCWVVAYARPSLFLENPISKPVLAVMNQADREKSSKVLQAVSEGLFAYGANVGETGDFEGSEDGARMFVLRTGEVKTLLELLEIRDATTQKEIDGASFGRSSEWDPWVCVGADRIIVAGSDILEKTSVKPRQDNVLQRFPRVGWVPHGGRDLLAFALLRWPDENARALQMKLRKSMEAAKEEADELQAICAEAFLAALPAKEVCVRAYAEKEGVTLSLVFAFATEEAAKTAAEALTGSKLKAVKVVAIAGAEVAPSEPPAETPTSQPVTKKANMQLLAGPLAKILEEAQVRAEAEYAFVDVLVTTAQADELCKAIAH